MCKFLEVYIFGIKVDEFYMQPFTKEFRPYQRSATPLSPDLMDPTTRNFPNVYSPTAHYSGGKLTHDIHHMRMHCVIFDVTKACFNGRRCKLYQNVNSINHWCSILSILWMKFVY